MLEQKGEIMTIKEKLLGKRDYLVDAYQQGVSTVKLGKEMGCSNASVYVFLRDACHIEMRIGINILDFSDKIYELYQEGLSGCQIANKLSLSSSSVRRYMKKQGWKIAVQKRCPVDLGSKNDEIVQLYTKENWTCLQIANKFQCDESTILRRLQNNNVNTSNRQYYFDEHFFDNINTEAKAYILGFAYGDGNNDGNSFRVSITDREIVDMIKKEMKYDGEIKMPKIRGKSTKQQYLICISSRELCKTLTKQGCQQNKTFKIKFPTNIVPNHLLSHFFRGMIDADGTLGCYKGKLVMSLLSTEHLLLGLQQFLLSNFDYGGSICTIYKDCKNLRKWSAGGNIACKKFAHWIYDDATIYLKRKHDIAQQYFLN